MSEPTKFVKDPLSGVRKISDEWKTWKKTQQEACTDPSSTSPSSSATTTSAATMESLPIITSIAAYQTQLGPDTQQSDSVTNSIKKLTTDEHFAAACQGAPNLPAPLSILDQLSAVFAKYETPIGLIEKLLLITEFDEIEMIVDSSGSIRKETHPQAGVDHFDKSHHGGKILSRWQETRVRISEMFEVLVWLPFPPITIRFLTDSRVISINQSMIREGQSREDFLNYVTGTLLPKSFDFRPTGQTPYLEHIKESFARQLKKETASTEHDEHGHNDHNHQKGKNKQHNNTQNKSATTSRNPIKIARYWFADGRPDGEVKAVRDIADILANRPDPKSNPVTFMSVTDTPDDVEWMQEVESSCPFVAEYSNYFEESKEIRREQSSLFPFSKGFWLVGEIVGALCDTDLDLLDEGIPLPKTVLDNLLGYKCLNEEYASYFNAFLEAQAAKFEEKRNVRSEEAHTSGSKKRKYSSRTPIEEARVESFQEGYIPTWKENYSVFLTTASIREIKAVQYYQGVVDGNIKEPKSNNAPPPRPPQQQQQRSSAVSTSENNNSNQAPTSSYQKMETDNNNNNNQTKKSKEGCPCVIQ